MTAYLEREQLSHSGQVSLELLQEQYFLDEIKGEFRIDAWSGPWGKHFLADLMPLFPCHTSKEIIL